MGKVQAGLEPVDWKPFDDVGAGTREIRIRDANGIYRVMYVARFEESIYVLHCFQKKTQATSKQDKAITVLIKSITPSNQLSYVAHFTAEGQGILVTGDAGCVDFRPGRQQPNYEKLLNALSPLHVVQVARHAGNNAHFYHVLRAARYPKAEPQSFLLLSHATQDRYRPSREFCQFVEDVRREPEIVSLLFTSQPRVHQIRGLEALVHAPIGRPADRGDVCLELQDGIWRVTKHAIAVAKILPE